MKCLVIGIVFNLGVDSISPFFISLRRYYQGEICIITPETDEQILEFYKEHNVTVVTKPISGDIYTACRERFSLINELLKTLYVDIDRIFFTDIRDVYFFDNIFKYQSNHSITFFSEPQILDKCSVNSDWYKRSYGIDEFEKVKNNLIVCNGTILATRNAMLNYTELMMVEVNTSNYVMDQANTNYLVHNNKVQDCEIKRHGDGPIATCTHDPELTYCTLIDHRLYNKNNTSVIVVHQYDRCNRLKDYVNDCCFFDRCIDNRTMYELCSDLFNRDEKLIDLRCFVWDNKLGYGDNEHYIMWEKLIHNQYNNFKFIEIGVYKGQVMALVSLFAKKYNITSQIYGVTPLRDLGDKYSVYDDANYLESIKLTHEKFEVDFNEHQIIKGLSTDPNVIALVKSLGKFDIVYVDGGHDYETVVSDIELAKEICNVNGYIVMDDASNFKDFNGLEIFQGHPEVSLAVNEHFENDINFKEKLCVGHNRIFQKIV